MLVSCDSFLRAEPVLAGYPVSDRGERYKLTVRPPSRRTALEAVVEYRC
jgi:hypothetical protein